MSNGPRPHLWRDHQEEGDVHIAAGIMQEKRRYQRMPFFTDVELSDSAGGPPIPARTLEISLGGVGLMSPKPLPEGSHIRLIFHLRNGSQTEVPETVHGMVRVLRSDIDGHRLGIEFSEPLRPDHNPKLLKKVESL